ncbi:cytochrome P450 family protein [Streptomyces sp. NPDC055897]
MTDTHNALPRCPFRLDATGTDIHTEAVDLRALGPATRVLLPGLPDDDIRIWSVTDPGLIRRLLTHPDISKDAHQHWPAYTGGRIPADWDLGIWVSVHNALSAYGAEHERLRRPLARAFSPRRIRDLSGQIEAITNTLLRDLQLTPPGESVDLRAAFAWRLPLLVANLILGVPADMHDRFRDAIGKIFLTSHDTGQAAAAVGQIYDLIGILIERKRREPGSDITSVLVTAPDDELSEQELADSLLLLIGAGHETTVNLLDHTITALATHPEQLAEILSGHRSWDDAVEESLRHQAPIASIPLRFAVHDLHDEQSGITFQAGDAVIINYAAAGRDPQTHATNADRFDIGRTQKTHLAFGYGPHLCLGAELARTEARIALRALFTRFPRLALAVPASGLDPLPSFVSNGHQDLPVVLRPAA